MWILFVQAVAEAASLVLPPATCARRPAGASVGLPRDLRGSKGHSVGRPSSRAQAGFADGQGGDSNDGGGSAGSALDGPSESAPAEGSFPTDGASCAWSSDCAATAWCNPASSRCQARDLPPVRAFVQDVAPILRDYCAGCHTAGQTGAIAGASGIPLVLDGMPHQSWQNLVAGGTSCGRDPHHRVCVDEPRLSLLAIKPLQLPGDPMPPGSAVVLYHSWSDPTLQAILEWIAQGAAAPPPDVAPADGGAPDASDAAAGPPPCDGTHDPAIDSCVIAEAFAVFVAPTGNDTTGAGTRQAPYATFAKALTAAAANHRRVFACAGDYVQTIDVGAAQDGASIYGGFDCATWSYTGAKLRLRPTMSPAVHVHDLQSGFTLRDADVASPDATTPGGSSNAALVANSQGVVFVRVKLTAGAGAAGGVGAVGGAGDGQVVGGSPAGDGLIDTDPAASCRSVPTCHLGGAGGVRNCAGGTSTTGGAGGGDFFGFDPLDYEIGLLYQNGGTGAPQPASATGSGTGDPGVCPRVGIEDYPALCGNGLDGAQGDDAGPGVGAMGTGTMGPSGWRGIRGGVGMSGSPGQGGGGASAAGWAYCMGPYSDGSCQCYGGLGGGGGGPGGCGGPGGIGGDPGGSSFALISIESTVTLSACTLAASNGGSGGSGGVGGLGQAGGPPGMGANFDGGNVYVSGCMGGTGGPGGAGGPGGGGLGGHSIGIAFVGAAPTQTGGTTVTFGRPGPGGSGDGNASGDTGLGAMVWSDWHDDAVAPAHAVMMLAAMPTGCRSGQVSWSAPDNVSADVTYEVCVSKTAGACAQGTGSSSFSGAATSFALPGLAGGTTVLRECAGDRRRHGRRLGHRDPARHARGHHETDHAREPDARPERDGYPRELVAGHG